MAAISKAVLITGCSTGIGRATAEGLARGGWTVYATARDPKTLDDLKDAGCKTLALDVTNEDSMRAAVEAVEEAEGAVGVLINNAGYGQSGAIESVDMEDVRRQFETNVFGLLRLTQLALPKMRAQGWGKVVNLSSMGGTLVFPGGGLYHATKYAVEAISDALRFEVKGFGIDTIVIQPGLIRTAFAANVTENMDDVPMEDGPYGKFNRVVEKTTAEAYDTPPLSWLGGDADAVAKVIAKAIGARRPKTRYSVTPSAKVLMLNRRLATDRIWDLFLKTQFPQPR